MWIDIDLTIIMAEAATSLLVGITIERLVEVLGFVNAIGSTQNISRKSLTVLDVSRVVFRDFGNFPLPEPSDFFVFDFFPFLPFFPLPPLPALTLESPSLISGVSGGDTIAPSVGSS